MRAIRLKLLEKVVISCLRSRLLENKNVWDNVTVPETYGHSFNVLNTFVHYPLL